MFTRQLKDPKQAKIIIADWSSEVMLSIQYHYAIKATLPIMLERVNSGEEFDSDWEFDAAFMANTADQYFQEFSFDEDDIKKMEELITSQYHQELLIVQQAVELSRQPKMNWAYLTKVI